MQDLTRLVDFVTKANWWILLIGSGYALGTASTPFYLGVVSGGLISTVNFHLLKQTLKKTMCSEMASESSRSLLGVVLAKYYLRFAVSAIIIFLLISRHIVHPLGLLVGLSVVVASVFLATLLVLKRLLFKEAV